MTDPTSLSVEQIRAFVIAGHGNLEQVRTMLADNPALLNAAYEWRAGDYEMAIQGAAHVGNVAIATYLLEQGAPLDICTAAMLGRSADVERFIQADPRQVEASGAHGIPLLTHAALSGKLDLVQWLVQAGAHTGMAAALHNAVSQANEAMVRWLLENGDPDLGWKNFQDQTALAVAQERGFAAIAALLSGHGATA
jgi:ankyrin repeat protein